MRNVLITGAANGVGKEIAKLLKNENLLIVDNDSKNLSSLAKELKCKSLVCDVSEPQAVHNLKNFIISNNFNLDTIINCAGLWTKGELSELNHEHFSKLNTLENIKKIIDTNTFGTIAIITELASLLIKNGKGQIININSQSGVNVEEFCPVYNASKHGGNSYRKAIQTDLAKHNIKITDVCPGLIKTDFYVRADDKLPETIMQQGLSAKDVAETVKYVFDLPHEITIPSIEIKNIKNY